MTSLGVCATTVYFSRCRYTGKERDAESGNDYFGARYYASTMGRFMSPDWSAQEEPVPYAKLDDPQSLNLYAYVLNNPMTRFDLDGHFDCGGANANGLGCQTQAAWQAINNGHEPFALSAGPGCVYTVGQSHMGELAPRASAFNLTIRFRAEVHRPSALVLNVRRARVIPRRIRIRFGDTPKSRSSGTGPLRRGKELPYISDIV
jgi:RHS repeat-associated protein